MHYRYKLVKVDGANGYTIRHISDDNNKVDTLAEIDGYTYIKADDISNQPKELEFEAVVLGDELKQIMLEQMYLKQSKLTARGKIRHIKDLEDDLTDLKKTVQFMARGFAGLWASLPQEMKDANPYKDNFDMFSEAVASTELRLDLESNQVEKISKILQDEAEFSQIVKDEYLGKM